MARGGVNVLFRLVQAFLILLFTVFGASSAWAMPDGWSEIYYPVAVSYDDSRPGDLAFAARAPPQELNHVSASSPAIFDPAAVGWFGHAFGTANQSINLGHLTRLAGPNVAPTGALNSVNYHAVALDVSIAGAHLTNVSSKGALHRWSVAEEVSAFFHSTIATNKGPLPPRVDISDDLNRINRSDVDAQYLYRDPDAGHGIEITLKNGSLEFNVAAGGDAAALGSGTDMFNSAMLRLQRDGVKVDRVQGVWIPGTGSDNYSQFINNVNSGMTRTDAARNTWTGRIAASHGYSEVVETTRPGSNVIDFEFVRP